MTEPLPPLRVGERELALARAVARYRFLSAAQLAHIDGGSAQHLSRRLKLMVEHKILALPAGQRAHLQLVTQPRVFALGRAGAKLLAHKDGLPVGHLDWATKNARATALFIQHTTETADTMLAFQRDTARAGVALIDHQDLIPQFPPDTHASKQPFALRVTILVKNVETPLSLIPDRLFSLLPANKRLNLALEHDRGTMPVKRSKLVGKSSYARKLRIYWEAWKTEEHKRRWGFQQFRVLTIAPSQERIATMITAARAITGRATGLFLFTTPQLIAQHGPLAPVWHDMTGARISLLGNPQPTTSA